MNRFLISFPLMLFLAPPLILMNALKMPRGLLYTKINIIILRDLWSIINIRNLPPPTALNFSLIKISYYLLEWRIHEFRNAVREGMLKRKTKGKERITKEGEGEREGEGGSRETVGDGKNIFYDVTNGFII